MTAVIETGICVYDGSGIICSWSQSARELLGFTSEEVLGHPIGKFFPTVTGVSGPHEMTLITKDNDILPFVVEKTDSVLIEGKVFNIIGFHPAHKLDGYYPTDGELHRDSQSGLYDSDSIASILHNETRKTIRYKQPFSVVGIRINGYGEMDELHGLGSKDLVVQTLAIILRNETRDVDIIGRLEEDIFVVALPSTSLKSAENVASRIKKVALRYSDEDTPFTIHVCHEAVSEYVSDWLEFISSRIEE